MFVRILDGKFQTSDVNVKCCGFEIGLWECLVRALLTKYLARAIHRQRRWNDSFITIKNSHGILYALNQTLLSSSHSHGPPARVINCAASGHLGHAPRHYRGEGETQCPLMARLKMHRWATKLKPPAWYCIAPSHANKTWPVRMSCGTCGIFRWAVHVKAKSTKAIIVIYFSRWFSPNSQICQECPLQYIYKDKNKM